jgi:hypothetical protein
MPQITNDTRAHKLILETIRRKADLKSRRLANWQCKNNPRDSYFDFETEWK